MSDATSAEIVKRTGITYRQLDWWLRQGYLRARHGGNAPGSGHQRTFTAHETRVVEAMAALVALGVTPAQAVRIGRRLATKGEANVGGLRITREAA